MGLYRLDSIPGPEGLKAAGGTGATLFGKYIGTLKDNGVSIM